MINRTVSVLFVLVLLLPSWAAEPSLEKLRKDFASRYVEAEPHMALARFYHDKGERLQAFLLLESARRGLLPREQFDEAFDRYFIKREPFDNSKEAEAALLKKHAQDPKAVEVLVKLADIYISRDDWPRARDLLEKAIKLNPDDFSNVDALAEVLRRDKKPKEAAQVIQDYLEKYPQSKEAYSRRIGPLMRKDPAAARKLLTEAIEKFPKEGPFLFNLGVLLQDENKLKEAEEHYVKAATLAKESPHIQGWTGRFFLKVKPDDSKAIEYYLNAYFLDPHFRDSEYAERRIGILSEGLARQEYEKLVKDGTSTAEIVRSRNPMVVGIAIDDLGKKWDPKNVSLLTEALGHDDEYVRAKALRALTNNVDRSFDKELKTLLSDSDLRMRGLAGYLAVKLWGKEGIKEVTPWLKDDAQLLRYDALSALLQHGGAEGRALVNEHKKVEKHPWFQRWLTTVDKKE